MSEPTYNQAAQQHLNFYTQLSQKPNTVILTQTAQAEFSIDHKQYPSLNTNLRPHGARHLWLQCQL